MSVALINIHKSVSESAFKISTKQFELSKYQQINLTEKKVRIMKSNIVKFSTNN